MKVEIIKLEDTNKVMNSEKCVIYEYLFGSEKTSLALVEIDGKYPDDGFAINKVFEEIILVLNGKGKIIIENKKYELKKNHAVLLKPNKKYRYEGNLKLATFTSPAFKMENHEVVV